MLRQEAGECLKEAVETKIGMSVLQMLKVWDSDDINAFNYDTYRFTASG